MARVLHLLKGDHTSEALSVITPQLAAGDHVSVAILGGAAPSLPPGVEIHRVPAETSYERLLELIFTSDNVITW